MILVWWVVKKEDKVVFRRIKRYRSLGNRLLPLQLVVEIGLLQVFAVYKISS